MNGSHLFPYEKNHCAWMTKLLCGRKNPCQPGLQWVGKPPLPKTPQVLLCLLISALAMCMYRMNFQNVLLKTTAAAGARLGMKLPLFHIEHKVLEWEADLFRISTGLRGCGWAPGKSRIGEIWPTTPYFMCCNGFNDEKERRGTLLPHCYCNCCHCDR